jgi:hypothetical protein
MRNFEPVKPKEDEFDDFDAYQAALEKYSDDLTDWKVDVKIAETRFKEEDRKRVEGEAVKVQTWKERMDKGKSLWTDYLDVISNPAIQITQAMVSVMQDCEKSAEIAYYLGKNPTEAAKISKMTPKEMERQILILEARFIADPKSIPPSTVQAPDAGATAETKGEEGEPTYPDADLEEDYQPPPPIPERKVSSAPAPITPVASGSSLANKDPEKMTPLEYRKWRDAGGGKE